jgi:hypothetical protein
MRMMSLQEISVVQEFGGGVGIRPDFANPAKVRFGRISGTKCGHFLDSSMPIVIQ